MSGRRGEGPNHPSKENPVSYLYGLLIVNSASAVIMFVAVIRIVTTPAALWTHRWASKTAWLIAALYFTPSTHSIIVPLGAAAAIFHTHKLNQPPTRPPADLPYAAGAPDTDNQDSQS